MEISGLTRLDDSTAALGQRTANCHVSHVGAKPPSLLALPSSTATAARIPTQSDASSAGAAAATVARRESHQASATVADAAFLPLDLTLR